MEKITSFEAAKLLGISSSKLGVLEKQGLIHAIRNHGKSLYYSSSEIAQIKNRPHQSISDEAAQVNAEIQLETVSSVSLFQKILRISGIFVAGYLVLTIAFATMFMVNPLQTSDFFGYYYRFNSLGQSQTPISMNESGNVLAASTGPVDAPYNTTVLADVLKPAAAASLVVVKAVDSQKFVQIVADPAQAAGTVPIVTTIEGTPGATGPQGPAGVTGPAGPAGSGSSGVSNLNILAGILTIAGAGINTVSTNGLDTITLTGTLPATGTAGTYGSATQVPVLTIDAEGRITGVTNTTITGFLTAEADTLATVTGRGNTTATNITTTGTGAITSAGLLTASNGLALATGAINLTGISGALNLSGLSASSISTGANTLTLTSSNFNITSTGVVTLKGAQTVDLTTPSATTLTIDSGTTGALNIGSQANAKTITIGNTTGATTLNFNSGTGNINFTVGPTSSSGKVQIGTSGTATPDLLVLDNGTTDPTGVNGGMYYNTGSGKLRCFENNVWANCITSPGSDVQSAASYPTTEALTNVGASEVTISSVSVTPSTATGDVYVRAKAGIISSNNTDQRIILSIENNATCTGSTLATNTITITSNQATPIGDFEIVAVDVDPGASFHAYSFCASTATGDTDIQLREMFATVIDTGADLAEMYTTSDASIEPGDVVSIDSNLQTGMKKSTGMYDQNVIGIVSTRPGIVIGSVNKEGVKALPVALSGRVPVKASAQNGPIKAGDYLTTSSIPGVAMKATQAGVIIGTAMTSFDGEGVGTVVAFVKNSFSNGLDVVPVFNEKPSLLDSIVKSITAVIGYFDEVFAKKIHIEELCLKKPDGSEVCINGDQINSLLPTPISTPMPVETPHITLPPSPTASSSASSSSDLVEQSAEHPTPAPESLPI